MHCHCLFYVKLPVPARLFGGIRSNISEGRGLSGLSSRHQKATTVALVESRRSFTNPRKCSKKTGNTDW